MNFQDFITKNKTPIVLLIGAFIIAGAIYFSGNQSQPESFKSAPAQNRNGFQLPTQLSTDVNDDCLIKGNISSGGEKIYHMPGCGSYEKTVIMENKGEQWFCTEEEAITAGWRKAKNCS